jgi:predicted dehydrogenase
VAIRVGVVGLGLMGDVMIVGFRQSGAYEVVACCDIDQTRAHEVAAKHGVPTVFTDPQALLDGVELDLLAIATPPSTHRWLTVEGFRRGWHVLCEKPTAMNAAEAEEMLDAQRRSGRIGVIDHELRFNPVRARIRRHIADGYIGEPRHVLQWSVNPGMWEMSSWTWWSTAEAGGGILGEVGSHQVDQLRWYLGEIATVSGRTHTFITERADRAGVVKPVTSDDYTAFRLRFASGALADVVLSAAGGHDSGRRVEVHGSAGSLVLDAEERLWGHRIGVSEVEDLSEPESMASLIGWPGDFYSPAFLRLAVALAEGIRTGRHPLPAPDMADGLAIQRVLDAVRASAGMEVAVA